MGWRFQRRIRLHKGLGVNLGKHGGSISARSALGAWGTKGYSVKSGVTGLSYRESWKESSSGGALLLVVVAVGVILWTVVKGIVWVGRRLVELWKRRRI